jgi:hypothetical protein
VRVGGGLERRSRHLVGADVVGVRVPADLVVGHHDVWLEAAHDPDELTDGHAERHGGEAARGQRDTLVRPARVGEAEPQVRHPEDARRPRHLRAPDRGQVVPHLRPVHHRVEDAARLAAGARHHQHLVAFGDVPGHRGGALARLVVRMGVHRHQPKAHRTPHRAARTIVAPPSTLTA